MPAPGALSPDQVVSRADGVLAEEVAGETVLLHPGSERYVRLNATGALLWRALERPCTVADLGDRLAAAFPIEPQRARADAAGFVVRVEALGLVRLGSGTG